MLILFLGVLCASWLMDSIHAESTTTLVLVALVLALLNVIIKPILVLFTLPFVILTFGLGILLINAVLLYLADILVGNSFTVQGFGAALLGALIISAVNLGVNLLLSPRPKIRFSVSHSGHSQRSRKSIREKDVIDV